MLMCPGCHAGLSALTPVASPLPATTMPATQHLPTTPLPQAPSLLSPLAVPQHVPVTSACPTSVGVCLPSAGHCVPSGHFLAGVQTPYVCGRMFQVPSAAGGVPPCLSLPHNACHLMCCVACPHACPSLRTCGGAAAHKLTPCRLPPEIRTSLHTSGGGLVDGDKRSVSPDTKINYPVGLNPFKTASEPATPARQSPSSGGASEGAWTAAGDSRVLLKTRQELEESGWYYGAMSWQQAATLLKDTAVGTFLVRDSASPQCLYSLSVQTANGPTSVRIHYSCGQFRLDCTGHSQKHMPEFGGVVELAQHYIHANSSQVWVDHEGKTFSPINIRQPLRRKAPSLQHLCRLAFNTAASEEAKRGLPLALRSYLDSYPHAC